MDFLDLAHERYSVRKFQSRSIEQEKLEAILEACRVAPTAMNIQPQKVYIIKSAEGLEKINKISPCIYGAPVVLMVAYDKNIVFHNVSDNNITSGEQDTSIVGTHMMLAAWSLGIGSCWVNRFSPAEVKKAFDLPESEQVVFLMPIGYADQDAIPSERHCTKKSLEDLCVEL